MVVKGLAARDTERVNRVVKKGIAFVCMLMLLTGCLFVGAQPAQAEYESEYNADIVITSPTAGSTFTAGSTQVIEWEFSCMGAYIYYSSDGGQTWGKIGESETGNFVWHVPSEVTNNAAIRVECVVIQITNTPYPPYLKQENFYYYNDVKDLKIKSALIIPDIDVTLPPIKLFPLAPSDLEAEAVSSTEIELTWEDNSANETGFKLERSLTQTSGYAEIADLEANETRYEDDSLTPGTTYFYRIKAYNAVGDSAYSPLTSAQTPSSPGVKPPDDDTTPSSETTVLRFYIDSDNYYVNDIITPMDAGPIIKDGRTLLPIRYVAAPLGANVDWNGGEQKVTVSLNGKVMYLWINQGQATVNGVQKPIDPLNSNVSPIIVPPGRTMLPLRFIAENLGCQVDWDPVSREVKVTYPKP